MQAAMVPYINHTCHMQVAMVKSISHTSLMQVVMVPSISHTCHTTQVGTLEPYQHRQTLEVDYRHTLR